MRKSILDFFNSSPPVKPIFSCETCEYYKGCLAFSEIEDKYRTREYEKKFNEEHIRLLKLCTNHLIGLLNK